MLDKNDQLATDIASDMSNFYGQMETFLFLIFFLIASHADAEKIGRKIAEEISTNFGSR